MKQMMYCHACDKDFNIDIDMQADGNHVFKCPHCKHEHCRVVKNGEITSERWSQRNGNLGMIFYPTVTRTSTATVIYTDNFLSDSWNSTTTATGFCYQRGGKNE